MSHWTKGVLFFLLLFQAVQSPAQETNDNSAAVVIKETAEPSIEKFPEPLVSRKGWDLTQAYSDVFKILADQNPCSRFYGGPRAATTVLNSFFQQVKALPLARDVSFQMVGRPRLLRDNTTGVRYRLFDTVMVNTNGSFYQRRLDPMDKYPSDVGIFGPGTRRARALILLHELGHLIQNDDGTWLIPDDGRNGPQSKANTLRVQQACHTQLKTLN
ncbi:MAG TPA: hypothetical protein VFI24_23235 [Pyrinomonadaceae bacterium]|nr:hypothetical protein [Pyrinomonadaceae bacterium]